MRCRLVFFLALIAGASAAPARAQDAPASAAGAVIYCHDEQRDVVMRTLATECRGKVVSEREARAIEERRRQQVSRAMSPRRPNVPPDARDASIGTAFFVDAAGGLVTNYHVVEGCRTVTIRDRSGEVIPAAVVATDPRNDLALLRAAIQSPGVAVFRLDGSTGAESPVTTVGFPTQGMAPLEPIMTAGTLIKGPSAPPRDDAEGPVRPPILIRANIRHGNSGGPILDRYGLVIGIMRAKIDTVRMFSETGRQIGDTGVGVAAGTVLEFLARNGAHVRVARGRDAIEPRQVLEFARPFVARADCWR